MKKTKLVIFKVLGEAKEQIDGDDINLDQVEIMKTNLAFMHGVSYDDVEVDFKDSYVPDIASDLIVREDGLFMFRPNPHAIFRAVEGIRPAFDLNHAELEEEFLTLLSKKDYCKAFIFA